MKNNIRFFPYSQKLYRALGIICISATALFCVVAGYALSEKNVSLAVTFAIFALLGAWCTGVCYRFLNTFLVFDDDGIYFFGGSSKRQVYLSWESIGFACITTNYRGFKMLLLSKEKQDYDSAKKTVRKHDLTMKEYTNGQLIIPFSNNENIEKIKDITLEKLGGITEY